MNLNMLHGLGSDDDTHEVHLKIELKPKKAEKPLPAPAASTPQLPNGVNPVGTPIEPDPGLQQKAETTQLSPLEETLFQAWTKANGIEDSDAPDAHYDYRGFYKHTNGQVHPPGSVEHFPDTFKQHGHPTFSQESMYSKGPADGGMWVGQPANTFMSQPPMAVSHDQGQSQDPIRDLINMLQQQK